MKFTCNLFKQNSEFNENFSFVRNLKMESEFLMKEGDKFVQNHEAKKAIESYQKALNSKLNDTDLYCTIATKLANVYFLLGEFQKCIEFLQVILKEKNSKYLKAIILLAKSYSALSNWKNAINYQKEALKIDPNNKELQKDLSFYILCSTPPNEIQYKSKNFLNNLKLSKEVKDLMTSLTKEGN